MTTYGQPGKREPNQPTSVVKENAAPKDREQPIIETVSVREWKPSWESIIRALR
jgi:hypothetical protein